MNSGELVKNTLDSIPNAKRDAKKITALVKSGGKVTGYKLSNGEVVDKPTAVQMAKSGNISGVGIAHRGNTEYLKSIPDGNESNNLNGLPTV